MSITNNNANSQSPRESESRGAILSSPAHPDVLEASDRAAVNRRRHQHNSLTGSSIQSSDSPRARLSSSVRTDSPQLENTIWYSQNVNLHRYKRLSTGFLLDGPSTSGHSSRSVTPLKDAKGKRREADGALPMAKRRGRPSVASSGLHLTDAVSHDVFSGISRDVSIAQDHDNLGRRQDGASSTKSVSYGFDTDPAQIVSMALALSEGRRRQAYTHRLVSDGTQRSRVTSSYTSKSGPDVVSPETVGRSRRAQKTAPVDGPSDTRPLTPRNDHRKLLRNVEAAGSPNSTDGAFSSPDSGETISRATQNRVQKAKTYFELAHEHRRLLPHLPPLRRPGVQTSSTPPESKVYNPLQYARNRKLRFREQQPLDTENEGWHDVAKVRAWVDAVITSHTETRHDPLECVRLPPLSLQAAEENPDDIDGEKPRKRKTDKPRRPKSDWVTFPGDLLADAHWIEQGLNKRKIYDRDNKPIFPPDTQFRFSGWRNLTPVDVPENLKVSSLDVSPTVDTEDIVAPPILPHFESVQVDGEKRKSKPKHSLRMDKGARRRRSILDYSSDTEDSDRTGGSNDGHDHRGRHVLRNPQKINIPDGDPFAKGAEATSRRSIKQSHRRSSEVESSRRSLSRHSKDLLERLYRHETSGHTTSESNGNSTRKRRFIGSLSLRRDEGTRRSFEEDSTAPSSPVAYGFPSIAINLSPPYSRSPSPTKRTGGHAGSKDKVKNEMEMVETTDFAERDPSKYPKPASITPEILVRGDSIGRRPRSRGTSPFSKHKSGSSSDRRYSTDRDVHHDLPANESGSRVAHSGHRIRGIFKGGRIAEIVNHEVSRVSDYIWKREAPRRAADSGSISGYESDSEQEPEKKVGNDAGDSAKKSPPQNEFSPQSAHTATPRSAHSGSPSDQRQQYHVQGLPSFTSPFQHDRDVQREKAREQSPGGTTAPGDGETAEEVHSIAHAKANRSPRIDRLQPAKINTSTGQSQWERRKSHGFSQALDLTRTKSASESFNDAINGRDRRDGRPIDATHLPLITISTDKTEEFQGTGRSVARHNDVSMQDVLRAQALLLMTAVKSTNIIKRWDEHQQPPSQFLVRTLQHCDPGKLHHLRARRREEHQIAASTLITLITSQSALLNDHLASFSATTTPTLHRDLQIVEDKADRTLFPRLRDLSDHAARLAQNLTTTSTLAVRAVNDDIAQAAKMKRRRGVFRFVRRLGFNLAEWVVVGLLWLIWLVAMVVRFAVGVVGRVWRGVTWLLWLR